MPSATPSIRAMPLVRESMGILCTRRDCKGRQRVGRMALSGWQLRLIGFENRRDFGLVGLVPNKSGFTLERIQLRFESQFQHRSARNIRRVIAASDFVTVINDTLTSVFIVPGKTAFRERPLPHILARHEMPQFSEEIEECKEHCCEIDSSPRPFSL